MYSVEKFLENLKKICFSELSDQLAKQITNRLSMECFIKRFIERISFAAPAKRNLDFADQFKTLVQ